MLVINIPADGLFLAVERRIRGDFSAQACKNAVCEYIDRFLEAKPDVILLNVCYRRALTPSEVFDSYLYDIETDEEGFAVKNEAGESVKRPAPVSGGLSKYFTSFFSCARRLLEKGIDIYEYAVSHIRASRCRVFLSVRMNDAHYTENPAVNSSFALKNERENTIGGGGEYLDFSRPAVRNYYRAYIEELLERYAVDGIELDWLRFPTVLPEEKRGDLQIISDYMKALRTLSDRYGATLAVRMLPTEEENLAEGFDACGWIGEGLVDILTVENFYIPTNYELPIAAWRESIEKRNKAKHPYRLLCGSDWGVSCVPRYSIAITPAYVRGFAKTCLENGADGVYLFNFFEEEDESSFELSVDESGAPFLKNCFFTRMEAAQEPDALPRRYVHIGNKNSRYPIVLKNGESYRFFSQIHPPYEKRKIVIGCDAAACPDIYVNKTLLNEANTEPILKGYEYIPKEELGKHLFIYAISQAAPFVFSATLPSGITEVEEIEIKNASGGSVELLWIEGACE